MLFVHVTSESDLLAVHELDLRVNWHDNDDEARRNALGIRRGHVNLVDSVMVLGGGARHH